jgi:hypothetical protein
LGAIAEEGGEEEATMAATTEVIEGEATNPMEEEEEVPNLLQIRISNFSHVLSSRSLEDAIGRQGSVIIIMLPMKT